MREKRWHKNNLPRDIPLVPSRRQLGGRGEEGTRRFFLCRPGGKYSILLFPDATLAYGFIMFISFKATSKFRM